MWITKFHPDVKDKAGQRGLDGSTPTIFWTKEGYHGVDN